MNAVMPNADPHGSYVALGAPVNALNIVLLGLRGHSLVNDEGVYLRNLSSALARLGHRVEVICGPPYPILDSPVKLARIPADLSVLPHAQAGTTTPRGYAPFLRPISQVTVLVRAIRYLRQLHRGEHPPDIIHVCHCGVFLPLLLQEWRMPIVASVHRPPTPNRSNRSNRLAWAPAWLTRQLDLQSLLHMPYRWAVRKLRGLTTVSEHARRELMRHSGRATPLLHLACVGVDTDRFCPRPELAPIPGRLITVLDSPAAVSELPTLLKALDQLRERIPRAHLVIVHRLALDDQRGSAVEGTEPHIIHKRAVCDELLANEYARAQVAVCLSADDWYCLSAAEAMGSGVPVVGADGNAVHELLAGVGLTYPSGESRILAEILVRLLTDSSLREQNRHKARLRIVERQAWPKVAYGLTHFYQQHLVRAPGVRRSPL